MLDLKENENLKDLKFKFSVLTEEKNNLHRELEELNQDIKRIVSLINQENLVICKSLAKKDKDIVIRIDKNKFWFQDNIFLKKEEEFVCVTNKTKSVMSKFILRMKGESC